MREHMRAQRNELHALGARLNGLRLILSLSTAFSQDSSSDNAGGARPHAIALTPPTASDPPLHSLHPLHVATSPPPDAPHSQPVSSSPTTTWHLTSCAPPRLTAGASGLHALQRMLDAMSECLPLPPPPPPPPTPTTPPTPPPSPLAPTLLHPLVTSVPLGVSCCSHAPFHTL